MIYGIFHQGSGIGNQLHRYVGTRVFATDKDYEWGMIAPELFKGSSFMNLDTGKPTDFMYHIEYPAGKVVADTNMPLFQEDTSNYDWRVKDLDDNIIIDGEWQGEEYFEHRLPEIREWLKVEPLEMPDDLCIINFRGGEYQYFPELFLPISYWNLAVAKMCMMYGTHLKFQVHTDDVELAKKFFPTYEVIHDVGLNWRSIRYARYLIISNSSFAILPALLNENVKKTIAPKGWARRNMGKQMMKYNVYKRFYHI